MTHTFYWIDAFTTKRFGGNPAGVCLLEHPVNDAWMQQLAAELNIAETAFLLPIGPKHWSLRWFSPLCEMELCGHATLAAAWSLWDREATLSPELTFSTLSGDLFAQRSPAGVRISLPRDEPEVLTNATILQALGSSVSWLGLSRLGPVAVMDCEEAVRTFRPDLEAIAQWPGVGLTVTAASEAADLDCVSRFFAPKVGIDEDSVTGSAHCALGPLWAKRLGKHRLKAYQASTRGGELHVEVGENDVHLTGCAHIIFKGECYA